MGGYSSSEGNQAGYSNAGSASQNEQTRDESSSAWNYAQNQSIQNALNQSAQQATNQTLQQAANQTTLYGQQAPFLQQLWGQGSQMAGADAGIAGQARNAWGQAVNGGINPGVADVIAQASANMGLDFQRNTIPGIERGAVGTGNLGGSRQGIAEGLAAGELSRNQANMATTLYTQALDQASRERTAALSMSGAMQNLPWQGLESFARVVGAPIMESYGTSVGQGYGQSTGSAFGQSSGSSYGTTQGGSQGTLHAFGGGISNSFANSTNVGGTDASGFNILGKK